MLILTAIGMAVLGAVYITGRERKKKKVLVFKAVATLLADVPAVCYALETGTVPAWCFAAGIFLYACADVLLEVKFMSGVVCFGAGHFCLIAGMLGYVKPQIVTALVLAAEYGAAYRIFRPYLKRLKKLKLPAIIYTGFLCGMSAMIFTAAAAEQGAAAWIRAAGSICFLVSDGMIGWNFVHRRRTRLSGTVLMILYYLAVYLLGAAFYL